MNFEIPLPSAEEKNKVLQNILQQGMPKKHNLFSVLRDIHAVFGLRNLFFGVGDCIYLALFFVTFLYASLLSVCRLTLYSIVFTASPVLYLCVWLLTLWKESLTDTLTMQRVCKFTPVYITAVRMLCFSVLSMVVDIPVAAAGNIMYDGDFLKLLLLSFCALFLYSVLLLSVLNLVRAKIAAVGLPFVWGFMCLLPLGLQKIQWEQVLRNAPYIALLLIAAVCAAAYLLLLNSYVKKGEYHADRA